MKKIALLASILALGSALLSAADAQKSSFSVTAAFPYVSKYVFRGQQLAKDSIQPSVEATYTDFYGGVWTNQPVTGHQDNEFDFYAGYKTALNDKWNVDFGLTMYYYPDAKTGNGVHRDTYENYLGITGNTKGLTHGVYVYYDYTLKNTTVQGQLGYSFPIPDFGASLDLTTNIGHVYADKGDDYTYWNVGLTVPYKISEKASVYAGVSYTNSDIDTIKRDLVWYQVGVTIGF